MNKVSLTEKFALLHEYWRPKVVAELNGQELKLAKVSNGLERYEIPMAGDVSSPAVGMSARST